MTEKSAIVQLLGERAVLLPSLLADAVAANDRLKLRLTLLQEAVSHARHPEQKPRSFDSERRAVGLADGQYDTMIAGARTLAGDRIMAPGAKMLVAGISDDLSAMLAPLQIADEEAAKPLTVRLAAIAGAIPSAEGDELAVRDLEAMTAARRGGTDSVHLLVMDAHKALNQLAARIAVETIDGAHVHHVEKEDRPRIKAFMAGLNRTAPLAFGHPGLGTTAARAGTRLTIQNDIGATDAHVLVVHVEALIVTITYTDIHRLRTKFFMSLFAEREITWSPLAEQAARGLGDGNIFFLIVGRFTAHDEADLIQFLEFLGSRIVFLIDWNKARKALQVFIGKNVAIEILNWAANHNYGHRAFLELGGVDLIFDAIRHVGAGRVPYGARLDETLGALESADFLRSVLRQTSEGLRAGRSSRLIRDEVQAELAQLFETAESAVFTVLVRHLGLTRMLAGAIAEMLTPGGQMPDEGRSALAQSAKRIEEKADRLTVMARDICTRIRQADTLRQLVDEVENATDALDECAFLLSLFPTDDAMANIEPVELLSGIVIESISYLVRALEAATLLPQGQRSDAADLLQSIDAVVGAERQADTAERDAFSALTRAPAGDARNLVIGLKVTGALEMATDHLAHAALSLRDRVLEELSE